jgi:hypothetical protein
MSEAKPKLSQHLIDLVRSALTGAKLKKFDDSIAVLEASLKQGAWISRGAVKADSGFYQGIARTAYERDYANEGPEAWELNHCLSFGVRFRGGNVQAALDQLRRGCGRDGKVIKLKLTDAQVLAWVALCEEKVQAMTFLNSARPAPRITAIGLSPKVTATLTEMNLDIDLSSIKMANIVPVYVDRVSKTGVTERVTVYKVEWSPGIVHNQSRFAGRGCHACGKYIPSGQFVPVEARDRKSQKLISLWLGCDCAANIFGIKDIGIAKESA